MTHQQLQQFKGIAELKDAPTLQIGEEFQPANFRIVFNWVEALAECIAGAYPSKGPAFIGYFNFAVKSHSALLLLPVSARDQALLAFRSRVSELDVLNQAMAKKWATCMIEGLPGHIKNKLWLQKANWSEW